MSHKQTVAILGSTGSIGTQTLDVIDRHSELFEVYALTAHSNIDLLVEQARIYPSIQVGAVWRFLSPAS